MPVHTSTHPLFLAHAKELIQIMQCLPPHEIAGLMKISNHLAQLNADRFKTWNINHNESNAKSAVFAFNGDVYNTLQAATLPKKNLSWLQEHLCILSGLYGVLRPLDLLQPYRLEMGTKLTTKCGHNLYQFWVKRITEYLNERIALGEHSAVINLASQEYFKVVDAKLLTVPVIDCVFEQKQGNGFKVIGFSAKRARGLMMRYCTMKQVKAIASLKAFTEDGYAFTPEFSSNRKLVFRK